MTFLGTAIAPCSEEKEEASKETHRIMLFLAALMVIGTLVRLYNLDALGLTYDESIQALAVKGILTQGYPSLALGHVYVRALPHLYLQALCVWLLGWGETALRLPSVLFNVAIIPLIYFFARDLLEKRTALIAATVVTFSAWEIEFSRVARMYTALQFFYMFSLYAFYQGFILKRPVYRYTTLPLSLITFTFHHFSFPLAFTPLLLKYVHNVIWRKTTMWFYTSALCIIYLFYWYYIGQLFSDKDTYGAVFDTNIGTNIWTSIYIQTERFISIPASIFFEQLIRFHHYFVFIFIFILLIYIVVLFKFIPHGKSIHFHASAILILISCFLNQIGLALLVLSLYTIVTGDFRTITRKSTLLILAIISISFIAWFAYASYDDRWYLAEESSASQLRRALSILLDYPHLYDKYVGFLLDSWFGFGLWTFIGIIMLIVRHFRKKEPQIFYLVVVCCLFPLIMISLFGDHFNQPRYFFHLYSLMIVIFAYTSSTLSGRLIWSVIDRIRMPSNYQMILIPSIILGIAVSIIVTDDLDILGPVRISQRTYTQYNTSDLKSLNQYRPYEVDYRTCSQWIKPNISPSDIIISFGAPITRYIYTGRVDFFLKLKTGSPVDIYTGSTHLPSLEALLEIIRRAKGRRVWILGDDCAFVPNWYSADMCDYLRRLEPYSICTGEDGRIKAYLLDGTG